MSEKNVSGQSLWQEGFGRLKKNRMAVYSSFYVIFMCFVALSATFISPYAFDEQNLRNALQGPGASYWLGTDHLGRDLLSRLIYGARTSMAVGIITAFFSLIIGGIYGAIAGWFGGLVDGLMMRTVDLVLSIPSLVLMILIMVIFQSLDLFESSEVEALVGILLALSLVGWTGLARIVRGQVLQVKANAICGGRHSSGIGAGAYYGAAYFS